MSEKWETMCGLILLSFALLATLPSPADAETVEKMFKAVEVDRNAFNAMVK